MRNNKHIALSIILGLSLTVRLTALEMSLHTEKDVYGPGDIILVTAELHNTSDAGVEVVLEGLLSGRSEMNSGRNCRLTATLGPEESQTLPVYQNAVGDAFPPDEYILTVSDMSGGIPGEELTVSFIVAGTLRELSYAVRMRRGLEEGPETRVFVRGEDIGVDWVSPEEGVSVTGTVVFPGGLEQNRELPFVLPAQAAGSYRLTVTAVKDGFQPETRTVLFAVIEARPEIPEPD